MQNQDTPVNKSAGTDRRTDQYTVRIASDPEVKDLPKRRQRTIIALFDLLQMHLSEFGGGRP